MRIVNIGFSPDPGRTAGNLEKLEGIVDRIFHEVFRAVPDLLILPELFSTGFVPESPGAEPEDASVSLEWMKSTAAFRNCAVVGSVPVLHAGGGMCNRLFFVRPDGSSEIYDKRHLYFGEEEKLFEQGKSRLFVDFRGWRIYFGICFDLRFPVWSRNDAASPADLYVNIANWPMARREAAAVLLKARAIENACYASLCNRTGHDSFLEYPDNSMVMDFRGREKGSRFFVGETPAVYADLDKEALERFRSSFPVLRYSDANIFVNNR